MMANIADNYKQWEKKLFWSLFLFKNEKNVSDACPLNLSQLASHTILMKCASNDVREHASVHAFRFNLSSHIKYLLNSYSSASTLPHTKQSTICPPSPNLA